MNTSKKKSTRNSTSFKSQDPEEDFEEIEFEEEAGDLEELAGEEFSESDLEEMEEELDSNEEREDSEEDYGDEDYENSVKKKKKIKNKKKADKDRYYVNPLEFDKEIGDYYESGHMSDNLATMISNIANKLSYAPNFINYTFREEMVGDGIIRMFKALTTKKYDHQKGATASAGPFSYFTRIAFNAFRNRIKKEKHMRETHEKYQNELMMFSENYNTITKNNQQRISVNPNSFY
jgi:hypothetical protein